MKQMITLFFSAWLILIATLLPVAHGAERITFYHLDLQQSPVAATDSNGEVIWREQYKPYGQRTIKEDSGGSRLWYTGKAHEEGTNLSYYGARWYHPETGRFMAIDPVDFQEENIHSFNRYAYANNNPYRYVDPDGRAPVSLVPFLNGLESGKLGSGGWGGASGPSSLARSVANKDVTNSGAILNNGWRTADGKFASPNSPVKAGAAAEQKVWDAVKQKPGWGLIEGRVSVRNSDGQLRVYDGAAVSPRGRTIGLEVKSGSATKTAPQRNFDSGVNTYNPAIGVGQSKGISIGRSLEIRVP